MTPTTTTTVDTLPSPKRTVPPPPSGRFEPLSTVRKVQSCLLARYHPGIERVATSGTFSLVLIFRCGAGVPEIYYDDGRLGATYPTHMTTVDHGHHHVWTGTARLRSDVRSGCCLSSPVAQLAGHWD